jgi:hypothetical protein
MRVSSIQVFFFGKEGGNERNSAQQVHHSNMFIGDCSSQHYSKSLKSTGIIMLSLIARLIVFQLIILFSLQTHSCYVHVMLMCTVSPKLKLVALFEDATPRQPLDKSHAKTIHQGNVEDNMLARHFVIDRRNVCAYLHHQIHMLKSRWDGTRKWNLWEATSS